MATNQLNAAAGFGEYCKNNNLVFDIPSVGKVGIGMDFADVLENFQDTCQCHLDIRWKGSECVFSERDKDVFSFTTKGPYVVGVKGDTIALQVPSESLYEHDGQAYVTDANIDGHMLSITGTGEIALKPVKGIPCAEYTAEDFGVVPKKKTRDFAVRARDAQQKLSEIMETKEPWTPSVKDPGTAPVDSGNISSKISSLSYKAFCLERPLANLKRCQHESWCDYTESRHIYEEKQKYLKGSYHDAAFPDDPSLEELIEKGKIVEDALGGYSLSPDITNDAYWTKETRYQHTTTTDGLEYVPEDGWHCDGKSYETPFVPKRERFASVEHLDREDQEYAEHLGFCGGGSQTVYHYSRAYEADVKHDDLHYIVARRWVNSRSYQAAYDNLENAYYKMTDARETYETAYQKLYDYKQSPEYAADCKELKEVRAQLEDLKEQRKNQELSDLCTAVDHLSSYAKTAGIQQ